MVQALKKERDEHKIQAASASVSELEAQNSRSKLARDKEALHDALQVNISLQSLLQRPGLQHRSILLLLGTFEIHTICLTSVNLHRWQKQRPRAWQTRPQRSKRSLAQHRRRRPKRSAARRPRRLTRRRRRPCMHTSCSSCSRSWSRHRKPARPFRWECIPPSSHASLADASYRSPVSCCQGRQIC
jgi:hypothetical protein